LSPRVVIGVPLYSNAGHLPEALESLLMQTFPDFALELVDDVSSDETPDIARRYEARHDRISYVRNEERLGMVRNWRRAFELARERHPEMEYFAWASDHDVWHPRWLGKVVEALDDDPDVVMAYPLSIGIDDDGDVVREPWEFDTHGIENIRRRTRLASDNMAAGDMVYSLFRADALERCGVYRLVLLPDRLLVNQLALHGQFKQVPEALWFRRFSSSVRPSYARQRASFFPGGAPFQSFLPWPVQHGAAAAWSLVVKGKGPDGSGRGEGLGLAALEFRLALSYQLRRAMRRRRKGLRQTLQNRTLPALTRPIGGDRAYRIITKAASRATDTAQDPDRDAAARARELVRMASETAAQLRRERALAASRKAKGKPQHEVPQSKAARDRAKRLRAKRKAKKAEAKRSEARVSR
jgi:hypothetical protein